MVIDIQMTHKGHSFNFQLKKKIAIVYIPDMKEYGSSYHESPWVYEIFFARLVNFLVTINCNDETLLNILYEDIQTRRLNEDKHGNIK